VFTARYALSPYIKQIRFVFKGIIHSVLQRTYSNTDRGHANCIIGIPIFNFAERRDMFTVSRKENWCKLHMRANAGQLQTLNIRHTNLIERSRSLHDAHSASGDMNSYNSQRICGQLYRIPGGQISFHQPVNVCGILWVSLFNLHKHSRRIYKKSRVPAPTSHDSSHTHKNDYRPHTL
jgi:hypothetical protein